MRKAVIRISLILVAALVLSSTITAIIIVILTEPDSFKHPYEVSIAYPISIGMIMLQTISALGSYLNLIKTVRNNRLYSALSFFLLPVLFFLYSLLFLGEKDIIPFLLIVELPFFTLLSTGFIWFRKQYQK